jgi:trimeric autotransporter adhesin
MFVTDSGTRRPFTRESLRIPTLLILAAVVTPRAQGQYIVNTLAGIGPATDWTVDGQAPTSVPTATPAGLLKDGAGNLYIAAAAQNRIYRLDALGQISVFAGKGTAGHTGDGGPATAGELNAPSAMARNPITGDIYVVDTGNGCIRKIDSRGVINTTIVSLNSPSGVAVDGSGVMYFSDRGNQRIYKLQGTQVSVVAGTGTAGYSGDGGPAAQARLNSPGGLAVDSSGALYVADSGNDMVRRIAGGIISLVAGCLPADCEYTTSGPATKVFVPAPRALATNGAGTIYIADFFGVRSLVGGVIDIVAGNRTAGFSGDGGPAVYSQLKTPLAVLVDGNGDVTIADSANHRVRRVSGGIIRTIAGDGRYPLASVIGVTVDPLGAPYFATGTQVLKYADGATTVIAGAQDSAGYGGDGGPAAAALLYLPVGLAFEPGGMLYVADQGNNAIRKIDVNAARTISTVAGNGTAGFSGDNGPAAAALLNGPGGLATDNTGNVYLSDIGNVRIRRMYPGQNITTLAGSGTSGYNGDGVPALEAQFRTPAQLALDNSSALYIADYGNHRIRRVSGGSVSTIAGTGTAGYTGDGGAATSAQLNYPSGVTVDRNGNLFVMDSANNRIRLVSGGAISTIAGNGSAGGSGDFGLAAAAQLNSPAFAAVDGSGRVYFTEFGGNKLRVLIPASLVNITMDPANPTLSFSWTQGAGNPASKSVTMGSVGGRAAFVATPSADWIKVTPTSGPTPGPLTITPVPGGMGPGTYSGTVLVTTTGASGGPFTIGVTLTISSGTSRCVTFDNSTATYGLSGGSGTIAVSAGCTWVAQSSASWLKVVSGGIGAGGGTISYTVDANPGTARTATIGANATLLTVTQAGAGVAGGALRFVPVTPCRIIDTRDAEGTFGGPVFGAYSSRSIPIPQSGCGIPSTAQAYSLNVTVVPSGSLGYLTLSPTGQSRPLVSTLNSPSGKIVANAAIVPAGTGGGVDVYVTDQTHVIMDINGYFAPTDTAGSLAFYAVTPCRIADTRNATGDFGGPSFSGGQSRSFTVPASACNIPSTAQAYSLNATVVPKGSLGYLTLWPSGSSAPLVSTLNSPDGSIVANAAIVPAGAGGAVSVYVTDPTDVILDINGYFAPAGSGGLNFYTASPCRIADTRDATGTFGGPQLGAGETRTFPVPSASCSIPGTAQAFSLNATVVPAQNLGFLTLWPAGGSLPLVSTLNSPKGLIVANAAIVPAGAAGAVNAFATDITHLVVDINGYFAP